MRILRWKTYARTLISLLSCFHVSFESCSVFLRFEFMFIHLSSSALLFSALLCSALLYFSLFWHFHVASVLYSLTSISISFSVFRTHITMVIVRTLHILYQHQSSKIWFDITPDPIHWSCPTAQPNKSFQSMRSADKNHLLYNFNDHHMTWHSFHLMNSSKFSYSAIRGDRG